MAWLCMRGEDWMMKSGTGNSEGKGLAKLRMETHSFKEMTPIGQRIWHHVGNPIALSLTKGKLGRFNKEIKAILISTGDYSPSSG